MFRNMPREPDLTPPDHDQYVRCGYCGERPGECREPDVCDQFHRLGKVVKCADCGDPIGDDETVCVECLAEVAPLLALADRVEALGREFADSGATDSFCFAGLAARAARDLRAQAGVETVGV